ncbi:MAG: hypothetical protein MJZ81_10770 [Bacteroidales bacterium]|nr:hypothetical protein [Bacteroidales bacterium]
MDCDAATEKRRPRILFLRRGGRLPERDRYFAKIYEDAGFEVIVRDIVPEETEQPDLKSIWFKELDDFDDAQTT